MKDDNRPPESNRVWEKLGDHGGRIQALEAAKYQTEQSIINVRSEVNNNVEKLEEKIERYIAATHELHKTILGKISRLNKFQITIIVGGTVVGAMVLGLFGCAAWLIVNFQYIKAIFE